MGRTTLTADERGGDGQGHRCRVENPYEVDINRLRELSTVSPWAFLPAVLFDWGCVALAILACESLRGTLLYWPAYALAIAVISSRQLAMSVIMHDAVHYRVFRNRWLNDLATDVLVGLPTFVRTRDFRHFHVSHHRYLQTEKDANRELWNTHDDDGNIYEEWIFPKTRSRFFLDISKRVVSLYGPQVIFIGVVRTTVSMIRHKRFLPAAGKVAYYTLAAAIIVRSGVWTEFLVYWIIPFCTWHVVLQYLRLIIEHSGVPTDAPYNKVRTTLPSWWERFFFLPHHIGYHIEHHYFPSVPFFRLPQLHAELQKDEVFRTRAHVCRSVSMGISECFVTKASAKAYVGGA